MNARFSNTFLGCVTVINTLVLIGWVFGVQTLISLSPNWVSTKPITSISLLIFCLILWFITNKKAVDAKIIKGLSLIPTLLVSTSLLSYLVSNNPLAISGKDNSAFNVYAGVPSVMTCVCLFIISYYGFFFDSKKLKKIKLVNSLGLFQIIVGFIAISGYAFNAPIFYYYYPSVSAAMSIITAFSFLILGIIMHGIKQGRN